MPDGPPVDLELSTQRLDRIVEYAPADQIVTVEAGLTLTRLQQELTSHGQRLAIDPPSPDRATLGGIVAANSYGPLRTRYGSIRDLIIGVSIVRADGTLAKGGGKVVKTVAGFDLPKLMCGSYGTLAFIATTTFRVHPLPETTISLSARVADPMLLVRRVRDLRLEPAAMIAINGDRGWMMYLRFEGFATGVRAQREKLLDLEETEWPAPQQHGPAVVRVGALPTQAAAMLEALAPLRPRMEWLPTLGLGVAVCSNSDHAEMERSRRTIMALGGWMTAGADRGPAPASLPLQRSIKRQFDPDNRLGPGRFIA